MKARRTLLMALPNKDQLKFHSYKDAKLLMEAIEKMIKEEIETISLDDLYNNLKIYEPKLAGSTNTSQNSQNVAFVSSNNTNSNNNTNEADNTTYGVSSTHTQSNTTSGDNLSDAVICAFLASQPNSPQINPDDLEEINPDDLEEIDLQWEIAMLTIRARRFIKWTCRKLDVNGQRVGFDRGRENSRRTVIMETPTKNALVAQDGIGGYDWSYQAEEEHPTNYALMTYTSSGSSSSSDSEVDSCSKTCLESVEARLAHYKKNEAVFEESINVLNLEVKLRDNALVENKKKLEKERDELKLTSKSLNNLLESDVIDKFKTGLGYNATSSTAASPAVESFVNSSEMLENQECNKSKSDKGYHTVPPPYTGNFIPFKPALMFMDEIVEIEPKTVRKNSFRPPVIEDWNSNDDSKVEFIPNVKDKTVRPSTEKIKFVKSARETVEKVETSKQNKHYPRGNQRNWNNLMSQRLRSDFKMINKACFICGSFEHLYNVCDKKVIRPVWNNSSRVNHKKFANKITHPHPNRRFVPQAVLTRSGKINTAGASINTVVRPVNTAGSKTVVNHPRPISNAYKRGYSQVTKPFNKYSTNKNSMFNKKVNTVKVKDTTARDRAVQKEYKEKGVINSGCSRHMTGNKYYLTEYEDYDGDFVSFGDGKGRSSGKVLLRVPRKDNIYSVDLKSVVPTKGLTCLFAKATIDESNLWHRRLSHINFKNMNKLVRGNLVRGLPSKIFENDHSYVACQKGKKHKASCKTKHVNSISKPLHMLHIDLFGPTNVKRLMKKSYCLVVTDDFSRFSWTLIKMKEEKAKEKGVVIKNIEDSSRPETESVEKTKKEVQGDVQMERDAKVALRLQAKWDKELIVERERQDEASKVAIVEMFDEVQARMDVDYELAARMT
ncbi:putative ribonuclease H-like domain-containing protein [Tanacetum coccineum]